MTILVALIAAYLIGSIPFGLLLTKAAGLGDVRDIGSGNIGATNVLRTGNKWLALATLLLDMGKGALAAFVAQQLIPTDFTLLLVPLVVVIGHCYPIWLQGKGGKGVATAFGAMLAYMPLLGLAGLVIWLTVFVLTRISSLAALIAFAAMPVLWIEYNNYYLKEPLGAVMLVAIVPVTLLIFFRHKANIKRLLNGTEPKFGRKE